MILLENTKYSHMFYERKLVMDRRISLMKKSVGTLIAKQNGVYQSNIDIHY